MTYSSFPAGPEYKLPCLWLFDTPYPVIMSLKAGKVGLSEKSRAVIEHDIPHYMGRSGDDLIFAITCTATAGEHRHLARVETGRRIVHPAFLLFGYDQGVVCAHRERGVNDSLIYNPRCLESYLHPSSSGSSLT